MIAHLKQLAKLLPLQLQNLAGFCNQKVEKHKTDRREVCVWKMAQNWQERGNEYALKFGTDHNQYILRILALEDEMMALKQENERQMQLLRQQSEHVVDQMANQAAAAVVE